MYNRPSFASPDRSTRHPILGVLSLALVMLGGLPVAFDARAESLEVADAPTRPDGKSRDEALAIYFERCDVTSSPVREGYARADWANLRADGHDAETLVELADQLAPGCQYIAFRSAILAMQRERSRPARPPQRASVVADQQQDGNPLRDTRDMLRPMVGIGWTCTAVGLTMFGIGLAGDRNEIVGLATLGGQLFMSSLIVTTIIGNTLFKGPAGALGDRDLREAANYFLFFGAALLVVGVVVAVALLGSVLDGGRAPDGALMGVLTASMLGSLITSSVLGQIANTDLLHNIDRELRAPTGRARRSQSNRLSMLVLPTASNRGGGAVLLGRW
jgi:hypothetical protein